LIGETIVFVLGFAGIAAMTLIWIRLWQFVSHKWYRFPIEKRGFARVLGIVLPSMMGGVIVLWFVTAERLFTCLTDLACGPNRAEGWLRLAILGLAYIPVEIVWKLLTSRNKSAFSEGANR